MKTVDEQIQEMYTVPKILEILTVHERGCKEFQQLLVELVKLIEKPETSIQYIYQWLIAKILKNISATKGLIVVLQNQTFSVKSVQGFILKGDVKEILGENLINQLIEKDIRLIVDNLRDFSEFGDCKLDFVNLLAISVSKDIQPFKLLILLGDKNGGFSEGDDEKVKMLFEVSAKQLSLVETKNNEIEKQQTKLKEFQSKKIKLEKDLTGKQNEIEEKKKEVIDLEVECSSLYKTINKRTVLAILFAAGLSVLTIFCINFFMASEIRMSALYFAIYFAITLIALGLLTRMQIGPAKVERDIR